MTPCMRLCWSSAALLQRVPMIDGLLLTLSFQAFPSAAHHQPTVYVSFRSPLLRPTSLPSSPDLRAFASSADEKLDQQLGDFVEQPARKKHLCYYYTQGLCTLGGESSHLAKFTHVFPDLKVNPQELKTIQRQPFEYYLVLDLEGMVEVLEFPVVMISATTLQVVDRFHRFVRPVKMSDARIKEYIKGKYGRWGLDCVWHDTAIPFVDVLRLFESWLEGYGIWDITDSGKLKQAAFVTCGNWDVKTKIPQQCIASAVDLPPYFWEWINLKDIYLNFYKKRAGGMLAMLKGLKMPMSGTHHVGLDDAHNIARLVQRLIIDGAVLKITAKRNMETSEVTFKFRYRIK